MKLLYPEKRTINEAAVIKWAQDVWNDAHEVMDGGCDGDCNDEPVFDDDDRPTTLEESVLLLEDLGVATFAS